MKVIGTTDTIKFDMLLAQLKKVTGLRYKQIIRAQAAQILGHAFKKTKVASKEKIIKSFYPINIPYGKHVGGKEWHTDKTDNKKFDMTWRLKDDRWKNILNYRKRGLTKSQFYFMGNAVGLKVDAPAYVLKAGAPIKPLVTGRASNDAGKGSSTKDYTLTMKATNVKANKSGLAEWKLKTAFKSRERHYRIALKKGVFKDIDETKKQFGLK